MGVLRTIGRKLNHPHVRKLGTKLAHAGFQIGKKAATNYLKQKYPTHHDSINQISSAFD